ncbi:PI-PLC X domain-containing protein 1 isoform X2 [Colossoma macropomum]|uniref:PI-PLC X domain-containing protein 1 isoform X2 n=1 Tax=Colossoma macropomum TaxID=42526 RepID=UPI001864201A|nr:PI-PLC X domain-containing protein 1 isoform X2 [Colossoma macropomum]
MAPISESDSDNEDWMSTIPEELWDIPLSSLAIPGSHDAMSYCLDITSSLVRSESDTFRLLDRVFYCFTRPLIYKWATTQETLRTVATWLSDHPKEIVILACSHFEGLSEKRHEDFIYSLKNIFGFKLCPRNADITLRGLWSSGHQVLLSYDDQAAARHKVLWKGIPYWWANKANADELLQYLERQKELGRPDGFFVAGLNLTADRCFIASHPQVSLKTLTMENWESVKKWLEDQKPGADPTNLNIIAGDFVGFIPFCSLVIALNKKLLKQRGP